MCKKNAYYRVDQQKAMIDAKKNQAMETKQSVSEIQKMSVKEQMKLLQQVKGLLNAGALT